MYTREEAKALVDKVINMATSAKADSTEVNLTGGERSGTRWANSSITTNLVQYDRQITATVRIGQKQGNASTRDFTDDGLECPLHLFAGRQVVTHRRQLPVRVSRRAHVAERDRRFVYFIEFGETHGIFCFFAHDEDHETGRERIKCPGVSDLHLFASGLAEDAPNTRHDPKTGHAGRLVDEKYSVCHDL